MTSDDLKDEVRLACRRMKSYREGMPFTELEKALSLYCFGLFLSKAENMSESDVKMYDNDIARTVVIEAVYKSLAPKVNTIIKHAPSFDRVQEATWASNKANHDKWSVCLTRALILLTRGLAYSYTGSVYDKSAVLNACSADFVNKAASTWLSEIDSGFIPSSSSFANKFLKSFLS